MVFWSRVEVEPSSLQKVLLKPFLIFAPKEFLRRKKERSFMEMHEEEEGYAYSL